MASFISEFKCKLDPKGRLVLPAKFKAALPETLGNELVLRKGEDPCIVVYPGFEFKKIYNKVAALSEFNPQERKFKRQFLSGLAEAELDNSGRFLIVKHMLEYAGIDKEAILVGMGSNIEIWDPEKYQAYSSMDQDEYSGLAEKYLGQ
ncbi:division/cell wall cluster transcriptional repressor MraZ [Anditalea andensis]|uniref:Transcriptional regulator MraZ n=1 Tax=Anditalea andensis TaxID=1048983 RepID=A0A074L3V8_9BACT|nr:division/cell wall cluster transcriptional repressor MraZ [Anditalea andensis]KEO75105.1 protein MraZ [Anditalea andensis]